jgi:hypothetical protein
LFSKTGQAKLIEPFVWEKVTELFRNSDFAKSIIEEAKKISAEEVQNQEDTPLKSRLMVIVRKLETLTERLSELPRGVSADPIYVQMRRLTEEKGDLERRLQESDLRQVHPRIPAHFNSYTALLDGLAEIAKRGGSADAKASVIKTLVHKVEVKKEGLRIHFYAGDQEIRRTNDGPAKGLFRSDSFFLSDGSNSLLNGGP